MPPCHHPPGNTPGSEAAACCCPVLGSTFVCCVTCCAVTHHLPQGQAALQPASHAGLWGALGTGAGKQQTMNLADEPVAGDSTWEAMMCVCVQSHSNASILVGADHSARAPMCRKMRAGFGADSRWNLVRCVKYDNVRMKK